MNQDDEGQLCAEEALKGAMEVLGIDDERGLEALDGLIGKHPGDPRLHFLKGSVLAGCGAIDDAHRAMLRAVELAPGFRIARFQLGLLQFTSGDAVSALATWQPLRSDSEEDALATFAAGLEALAGDGFAEAIDLLRLGMALNRENPPLNKDMALLIDTIKAKSEGSGADDGETDEPMSLTQLALQQSAAKSTRH